MQSKSPTFSARLKIGTFNHRTRHETAQKMNRTLSGHCWTTSGGRNFYNGFLVLSGQWRLRVRRGRTARNFHVAEKRPRKMSEKCSSKVGNESFSVSQSSAGNPAGRRVHHVDQSVRLVRLFMIVFICNLWYLQNYIDFLNDLIFLQLKIADETSTRKPSVQYKE